jgi:copper chaperone CopZ
MCMDPARPNDSDPADPFVPTRGDGPVSETIEIATEGEDCDACVLALREPLMKISGVIDVKADPKRERVTVTFDARKVHPPDLHDVILASGYKPARFVDE